MCVLIGKTRTESVSDQLIPAIMWVKAHCSLEVTVKCSERLTYPHRLDEFSVRQGRFGQGSGPTLS